LIVLYKALGGWKDEATPDKAIISCKSQLMDALQVERLYITVCPFSSNAGRQRKRF
jgi:hypothetical protein